MNSSILKMSFTLSAMVFALAAAGACSSSSSDPAPAGPGGCSGGPGGTSATCNSCVQAKCATQFNSCFGSGGVCATYYSCVTACPCNDTTCYSKCTASADCQTCLGTLGGCQTSSCATECKRSTGGGDAGTDSGPTATCADLKVCCDTGTFADASQKDTCNSLQSGSDDKTCASVLNGFKSAGYCH